MFHTVKSGDSMGKIAAAHDVTVGALVRANPQIEDPSLIVPGQQINIPVIEEEAPDEIGLPAFTELYRVRSGDTMRKIARTFAVSLSDLVTANPQIINPNVIRVGDVIHVPPSGRTAIVQKVTAPPSGSAPMWYRIAKRELEDAVVEFPGRSVHNPRIIEYHASVPGGFDEDEVPWCSSFVNWCMEQSDTHGSENAGARSWEKWGTTLSEPKLGAVSVFWRGTKSSGKGHVGFFVKATSAGVSVLGGNQGNQVSVDTYPKERLLSYRWPET